MDDDFFKLTRNRYKDLNKILGSQKGIIICLIQNEDGEQFIVKAIHRQTLKKHNVLFPGKGLVKLQIFFEFFLTHITELQELTQKNEFLTTLVEFVSGSRIVENIDYGQTYIVYEYSGEPSMTFDGERFKTCDGRCNFTQNEVARMTLNVLAGLEALHNRGWQHGDIKPSNILVDSHGVCRICDFDFINDRLMPGGTAWFRSPRYFAHSFRDNPDSLYLAQQEDLYALGITIVIWLTGKLPNQSDHVNGIYPDQEISLGIDYDSIPMPAVIRCLIEGGTINSCRRYLLDINADKPSSPSTRVD